MSLRDLGGISALCLITAIVTACAGSGSGVLYRSSDDAESLLAEFQLSDASAWRADGDDGDAWLEVFLASGYEPPFRSPLNIAPRRWSELWRLHPRRRGAANRAGVRTPGPVPVLRLPGAGPFLLRAPRLRRRRERPQRVHRGQCPRGGTSPSGRQRGLNGGKTPGIECAWNGGSRTGASGSTSTT